MTGEAERHDAARQAAALLFCVSLLALGSWLALVSSPAPITAAFTLPWWALIPVYVVTQHYPVDFENRRGTYSLNFNQLPLAFGIVLVAPGYHLLARLIGVGLDCIALRRQAPLKVCFNLGSAAVDIGVAATAVGFLAHAHRPGPSLWVALIVSQFITELVGGAALAAVWRLVGVPVHPRQHLEAFGFAIVMSATFTGLSIVTVSAVYTDRTSLVIMTALGGALGLAYRGHRRLFAQQRTTEQLYEFVKDLGPVSFDSEALGPLLDEVRVLLHARHLDLAVPTDNGWIHHVVSEEDTLAAARPDADEVADTVARAGTALRSSPGELDRMSTPLMGARKLVAILTVTDRLGEIRRFDMGDVRLLETVAAELTTSFERGKLLRDLERSATEDSLTGLPNLSEATRLINAALETDELLVAAVAVESFREVNDTLGHEIGDFLLLEVTDRLRRALPDAIIGRIGGGRFAVAMKAATLGHDPSMFGLGIRAQVEGTTHLGGVGTHIRLSVGVVRAPEHGDAAATLLRRAETAMHSARNAHGGPVVWEPAYEVKGQRRLAVVSALREALSTGAIGVAFQPKVDSCTAAPVGVEALARWTHPALGAIGPDEFIPLAEASGLMGLLTSTVLRQALTACRGWQRRSPGVGVAVNVSATTLLDASFVTQVAAILTAAGVDPSLLTLELTEGVVMADPELAAERMGELRAIGVKISVDDFGTGYSSLTYLKGLPVDEVKIDRGFVNGLAREPADRAVVRAVVDIAHTLGMRVVAEGVENEAQRQVLQDLAVDELQGYLYARPMPAMEISQWLRQGERAVRL
jgi:diguanylate cyclase (GGDEF)-like protein